MSRFLLVMLVIALTITATSAFAAITRVDVNGELVNGVTDNDLFPSNGKVAQNPSSDLALKPTGWDVYGQYDGTNTGGTVGWNYFSGSSLGTPDNAGKYIMNNGTSAEAEPGVTGFAGHSVVLGTAHNADSTVTAYGISQTFTAQAGKLYWFVGGETLGQSAGTTFPRFSYGLQAGTAVDGGHEEVFNAGNNYFQNGGRFQDTYYATTSGQVTAHVGMVNRNGVAGNTWFMNYIDGLRIYEVDVPTYSSLQNGGFDQGTYSLQNPTDVFAGASWTGWSPTGFGTGLYASYLDGVGATGATTDRGVQGQMRGGSGRFGLMQHVKSADGAGFYTLSGQIKCTTNTTGADPRIGIDPTGGMDWNSSNIVWTTAIALNQTAWRTKTLTNVASTNASGVTVFLAWGNAADTQNINYHHAFFDNISLTFVPEPSSVLALGTALAGFAGLMIRRRR